jgi:hypothetical protein
MIIGARAKPVATLKYAGEVGLTARISTKSRAFSPRSWISSRIETVAITRAEDTI